MFSSLRSGRRRYLVSSTLLLTSPFVLYSYHNRRQILHTEAFSQKPWPEQQNPGFGTGTGYDEKISASGKSIGPGDKETEHAKPGFGGDDDAAWASFSSKFADAGSSLVSFKWSSIGEKLSGMIMPTWALHIPAYVNKLQNELNMEPGSLADEIWQESMDPVINPEIEWNARVRIGKGLCPEEIAFQERRREYTTRALAKYLEIPEQDINPEDVPTIAMCGSGGGLRALVAGASSYLSAQEVGLFDCVTYTAGVSGSCWLQALYHSSLAGQNHINLINHLKRRIGIHIAFPPPALNLLTTAPTNKFLLSGLMEKVKADPYATFGLVDIYGLLLGARLLVPRGELEIEARDLKVSNQRVNVDTGANPMPIYTAVRHEIPLSEIKTLEERTESNPTESMKRKAKEESWFQWFEWTPYEFFSEEIDAGIPTWALGRHFRNGVNVPREDNLNLPEMRVPQLLGIWGSAFCATLSHYYKEVRPIVKGISGFGGLDGLIEERNDDLVKVHPIDPAMIPNFILGLESQLPPTTPKSMFIQSHLQLMDAGMSNNLPIYPLLRPGRDVDILIAFDASADIKKENWLSVADGYAKQRGIKGWPIGVGWPKEDISSEQTAQELDEAQASSSKEAAEKVTTARDQQAENAKQAHADTKTREKTDPTQQDLGYCTVWIGTTQQRESDSSVPPTKRLDASSPSSPENQEWDKLDPHDSGIAVIYFPFIPNAKVPGVDPETSAFMSTWNFVYTPEEIDKVVALARANFEEGREQTKRCVRAVYERKRKGRVEREKMREERVWRSRFKGDGDQFRG